MKHLLKHPSHAENEAICLNRFPNKLKDNLQCSGGVNPGWGLQFVEYWDMKKIWAIAYILFVLGSLLIGVLWTGYEHSIQDAFAVSSYMLAFATISLGSLQALLVM